MKRRTRRIETQLAVIGTGIAGFAASVFARALGLEVAQFGHSGAIGYTTGYFDLLGVRDGRVLVDPWAALDELREVESDHPLTRLGNSQIRTAFNEFTGAISEMGIGYTAPGDHNLLALLPYGKVKPTLSVPNTMQPGVEARARAARTMIVGFDGLQGFSATEFVLNSGEDWPGLTAARLEFPGLRGGQVFAEVMARSLETEATRAALAARIRPIVNGADYVGLPAILGVNAPDTVLADMQERIGAKLFEIPTIPPAVPGIRLRELFERALPERGVTLEPQLRVSDAAFDDAGATLTLHGAMDDVEVRADAVILATGRFLSGGLKSDRSSLSEPLVGLPVRQPSGRENWYRDDYLDPRGHRINRAGVEIGADFRPLAQGGSPFNQRLFAAGAILSGQDWVRQRCGAGLAITTAYGAAGAAARFLSD